MDLKKYNIVRILAEADNITDITNTQLGKELVDGIMSLLPTLGISIISIIYTKDTKTATLKGTIKDSITFIMTNNVSESGFLISTNNYIKVDIELLDGMKKLHGYYSEAFAPKVQKSITDGSIDGQ